MLRDSRGELITVRVTAIRGNQVKLGIEAPDSVRITRLDLCPEKADAALQEAVGGEMLGEGL
jgi:carbon storage regulator CsrA